MARRADAINAALIRLLLEARKQENLSMEELADRAGVHRTYIGLLERGERQPTVVAAASLADALGLNLSDLVAGAERTAASDEADSAAAEAEIVIATDLRHPNPDCLADDSELRNATGLSGKAILAALDDTYHTLDLLDQQLIDNGLAPFAGLVELANLSSMIGNIAGAAIARHSGGRYERSGPHKYQDLRSTGDGEHVEIKTALETNKPKGHLSKAGHYLTFRYVLGDRDGTYQRGERGETVWIWEARFGELSERDFDESDTPGDSGKTAVVKTEVLKSMERIYFDPNLFPYARLTGPWGNAE